MIANIEALGAHKCDGILVDCTTSGAALKDEYPALIKKRMAEDPQNSPASWGKLAAVAQKIADKTTDILSFIVAHRKELVFDETFPNQDNVAYHTPCHSRNSFNTLPLVQSLLRELPFMTYTPTLDEAECCGGGGTFFYEHPKGDFFYAAVGDVHDTFMKGCQALDHACCVHVPEKGDFVLFSAGGHRTDGQLYQAAKALFNAINVVKEGGQILFVAGCGQGIGNVAFAQELKNFNQNRKGLGQRLVSDFDMPSYVALRVIDILNRFQVTLASTLTREQTRKLGFEYADNINHYAESLTGKGYIIPFAENILAQEKQDG